MYISKRIIYAWEFAHAMTKSHLIEERYIGEDEKIDINFNGVLKETSWVEIGINTLVSLTDLKLNRNTCPLGMELRTVSRWQFSKTNVH